MNLNVRRATGDGRRAKCDGRRAKCDGRRATCIIFLFVAACSAVNSQTNSFATLDEARKAGAVEDGRVPGWLPPGSHEIRAAHVPGTGSVWGLVNFPAEQGTVLREALAAEEVALEGLQTGAPSRIEWWPIELRGTLNGERLRMVGIRAHRARQGNLIVAVNWNQGRAYYWSPR